MNHTPGVWVARIQGTDARMCEVSVAGLPPIVQWLGFDDSNRTRTEHAANAARIVACVNSMQGVPDPAALMEAVRKAREELDRIATLRGVPRNPRIADLAHIAHHALAALNAAMEGHK